MGIALVFPGQGSQYMGMGKELCNMHKIANDTFSEASEITGINLKKICFEGSSDELTRTIIAQQVIFTLGVSSYRVYMQEIGVIPELFAGNSLGEITALTCASVIDFRDGVNIVRKRAEYMQEACEYCDGMMAAIGNVEEIEIREECRRVSNNASSVYISNYNSHNQIVISGHRDLVVKLIEKYKAKGAKTQYLKVSGAFHSSLMSSAAFKMQEELKRYKFNDFCIPVVSNVTAQPYKSKEELVEKLAFQIIKPVQWGRTIQYFEESGIGKVVELSPGHILKGLMKHNSDKIRCFSFDVKEDVKKLKTSVFYEEKPYLNNIVTLCLANSVSMKNNEQGSEEDFLKAISKYKEVYSLYKDLKKDMRIPKRDEMLKSLNMLLFVMKIKNINIDDQYKVIKKIINSSGCKHLFGNIVLKDSQINFEMEGV